MEVAFAGISSVERKATLFLPRVNGVVLSGWASLDRGNCPEATSVLTREVQLLTIDGENYQDVGFVKIDVEGHEIEVLAGAEETIQRDHPHLLIEIRECHLAEARRLLEAWGYREVRLEALCGIPGSPQNHIFLPNSVDS